jgi:hypothetical protein
MFELLILYQTLIFIFFIYFYKKIIFGNNLIHISSFHFAYFFAFYFLGAAKLYVEGGLINHKYYFSVTLYPVVAILGMYTAKAINKKNLENLTVNLKNIKYIYTFVFVVTILYVLSLEKIPLSYVLDGDVIGAAVGRTSATKEYEGPRILYYAFRVIVDYVLIYLLIFIYIKNEKITNYFVVSLIVALNISLVDFQKYPAINILLILSVAVFIFKSATRASRMSIGVLINYKIILILIFSYLVLGVLWAAAAGKLNNGDMFEAFESIIAAANSMVGDRLLFGQNRPLYVVYQIVPDQYDYFLGKTFPNPLRIMPFEPIPFTYMVYDVVHSSGEGIDGVRGSAPTVFFSTIYANFGIVVSFISMYAFGFVVQFLNEKLLCANKYIIPYRFVILNYVTLFALSIDFIFLSERVVSLVLLYLIMHKKTRKA